MTELRMHAGQLSQHVESLTATEHERLRNNSTTAADVEICRIEVDRLTQENANVSSLRSIVVCI